MNEHTNAADQLLSSWLHLSSAIWNTRLVVSLTFNEARVLGILHHHQNSDSPLSATDLIAETRLLKSQMNKLLGGLERSGFIERSRFMTDRRKIGIRLTPSGEAAYLAEHQRIQKLLATLVAEAGEARILRLSDEVEQMTKIIESVLKN